MQNLMMSSGPTQVKVADDQSTLLPRAIKQAIIDPISAGTGVSVAEQTSAPHTPATESLRPMVATSSVSLFAPIWAFSFSPKVAKSVTMIGAGATTAIVSTCTSFLLVYVGLCKQWCWRWRGAAQNAASAEPLDHH